MADEETFTRLTLFVPGAPASEEAWGTALRAGGLRLAKGALQGDGVEARVEAEWVANDGQFGQAFSFGTVDDAGVAAIDAAPGALVLSWHVDLREGRAQVVEAVRRLREAGALAVRIEQSKLGWAIDRWLELFSSDDPSDWHRGAIAFLGGEETFQSCGMHAFSLPDAQGLDGLQPFAEVLNVYQLAEDPVIRSGQTFTTDLDTPRRTLERWPDVRYPPDHACHNPYGVWRLGPAGGTSRPLGEQELVFMPALRVLLEALAGKGKRLTREQVEEVRDGGTCVAMPPRQAQHMERVRGYADLDPELVWEQWQLVREQR